MEMTMACDGDTQRRFRFDVDLAEVEATLQVLVEAELVAQHEFEPHAPPVDECPVCRRLGECRRRHAKGA